MSHFVDSVAIDLTADSTQHARVIDAALDCLSLYGLSKTTVDDIAKAASISRATVYRLFPGGKQALIDELCQRELQAFVAELVEVTSGVHDLDELLVTAISFASCALLEHPVVSHLMRREPEALIALLTFDRFDAALELIRSVGSPLAVRFVDRQTAEELSEWVARMVVSLAFAPGFVDPSDRVAVRRVVCDYLNPSFTHQHPLQSAQGASDVRN